MKHPHACQRGYRAASEDRGEIRAADSTHEHRGCPPNEEIAAGLCPKVAVTTPSDRWRTKGIKPRAATYNANSEFLAMSGKCIGRCVADDGIATPTPIEPNDGLPSFTLPASLDRATGRYHQFTQISDRGLPEPLILKRMSSPLRLTALLTAAARRDRC